MQHRLQKVILPQLKAITKDSIGDSGLKAVVLPEYYEKEKPT